MSTTIADVSSFKPPCARMMAVTILSGADCILTLSSLRILVTLGYMHTELGGGFGRGGRVRMPVLQHNSRKPAKLVFDSDRTSRDGLRFERIKAHLVRPATRHVRDSRDALECVPDPVASHNEACTTGWK